MTRNNKYELLQTKLITDVADAEYNLNGQFEEAVRAR